MGFNTPLTSMTQTQLNQIAAAVPQPAAIVGAAVAGNVPTPAVIGVQVNSNVKTRYVVTLLSGSAWVVPAGVMYVIAKLIGGGGGSSPNSTDVTRGENHGGDGSEIITTVATTPGASIPFSIGAGGPGAQAGGYAPASPGGTTTFTGATSAPGGQGAGANGSIGNGTAAIGKGALGGSNGGLVSVTGGTGGNGKIELEYWA